MFKLDDAFLQEIGLGSLPPADKQAMLKHIYETLEMRVGVKLAEQMSNEQLDEFEGYINKNDEDGALKWLETNFPNYKNVVAQQLEGLKQEIAASAPQIVAASSSNQGSDASTSISEPNVQQPAPSPVSPPLNSQQTPPTPTDTQPL